MAVEEATIRQGTYKAVYDVIDANMLGGWTVLSSYPENNPTFPCVVIEQADNEPDYLTIDGTCRDNSMMVDIGIYSLARNGKEQHDEGRDKVADILNDALSTFKDTHGIVLQMIEDGTTSTFIETNQKIHFGNIIARFKLV